MPELAPHEVALLMHPNSSCAGWFVRVEVLVARNVDCVRVRVRCVLFVCCVALCVVCARVCCAETYAMYAHQFAHQY